MWECPDFYPVLIKSPLGIDTSIDGPNTKHVLKVSLDDTKHDYYEMRLEVITRIRISLFWITDRSIKTLD